MRTWWGLPLSSQTARVFHHRLRFPAFSVLFVSSDVLKCLARHMSSSGRCPQALDAASYSTTGGLRVLPKPENTRFLPHALLGTPWLKWRIFKNASNIRLDVV